MAVINRLKVKDVSPSTAITTKHQTGVRNTKGSTEVKPRINSLKLMHIIFKES